MKCCTFEMYELRVHHLTRLSAPSGSEIILT